MSETLNPYDLVVLVALVVMTFWGGMRGVISQIASILSWVASWYVATHYYSVAARFIDADAPWRIPAATVVTFIASALAIRLASTFLRRMISLAGLSEFDRQMGALFGLAKGALLILLATYFALLLSERAQTTINASRSGPYVVMALRYVQERVPQTEPTKDFESIADEVEEQSETKTESMSIAQQVASLREKLIKNGFLSNTATQIVEETEKTTEQGARSAASKESQSFGGVLATLTTQASALKEKLTSLADPEAESNAAPSKAPSSSLSFSPAPSSNASPTSSQTPTASSPFSSLFSSPKTSSASQAAPTADRASQSSTLFGRFGDYGYGDDSAYWEDDEFNSGATAEDARASATFSQAAEDLASFLNSIGGGYGSGGSLSPNSDAGAQGTARAARATNGGYYPQYGGSRSRSF